MKTCTKCNIKKEETEFYHKKSRCKQCLNKLKKIWKKNNPEKLKAQRKRYEAKPHTRKIKKEYMRNYMNKIETRYDAWKRRAMRDKIGWDLTIEYLKSLPLICHYSGYNLTLLANKENTVSLDRIDSQIGYTKDNVVLCCADINYMKNKFSKDYFLNLLKIIANHTRV